MGTGTEGTCDHHRLTCMEGVGIKARSGTGNVVATRVGVIEVVVAAAEWGTEEACARMHTGKDLLEASRRRRETETRTMM